MCTCSDFHSHTDWGLSQFSPRVLWKHCRVYKLRCIQRCVSCSSTLVFNVLSHCWRLVTNKRAGLAMSMPPLFTRLYTRLGWTGLRSKSSHFSYLEMRAPSGPSVHHVQLTLCVEFEMKVFSRTCRKNITSTLAYHDSRIMMWLILGNMSCLIWKILPSVSLCKFSLNHSIVHRLRNHEDLNWRAIFHCVENFTSNFTEYYACQKLNW